jgi:hypothetical protein
MAKRHRRGEREVYREAGRRWCVLWREGGRRRYRGWFQD